MIHSIDLEQHLLGALIKYPDQYAEIQSFIDENDFYATPNRILFKLFGYSYNLTRRNSSN